MSTPATIIKRSLRLIGVLAAGESPSGEEQNDALQALNEFLGSLSNEKLMLYDDNEEELQLVAGTQSYTIGSGGDFDTVRPMKITRARLKIVTQTPNYELPMSVATENEWASITQKTTSSKIVTHLYYDATYPLGTIEVYPNPSAAEKVIINSQKLIKSFSSASTTLNMPEGWEQMLAFNLAVILAPEYGRPVDPAVMNEAMRSKRALRMTNQKPLTMQNEVAAIIGKKSFNWLSGE